MESLAPQDFEQLIPFLVTALLSTGFLGQLKKAFPWMSSSQLRFFASILIPFGLGFLLSLLLGADAGESFMKGLTVYAMSSGAYLIGKDKVKPAVLTEQLSTQPPAITDTLLDLSGQLSELPSDDPIRRLFEPMRDLILDERLPKIKAEAGLYAEQAKGEETNE